MEVQSSFLVYGFGQTYLRSDTVIEIGQYALAVHTLGSSRQTEKYLRLVVFKQALICRRSGVVELVHDDEIVVVGRGYLVKGLRVERLNGNEQVFKALGHDAANAEIAEIRIVEHSAEAFYTLPEDLFSVRHKEKSCTPVFLTETLVIKCGNDSFACTRCGDNKVLPVMTYLTLGSQLVQNLLLIGEWAYIKAVIIIRGMILLGFETASDAHGHRENTGKIGAVPVVLKGGIYLADGVGLVVSGDFQVPFKAACHGGI